MVKFTEQPIWDKMRLLREEASIPIEEFYKYLGNAGSEKLQEWIKFAAIGDLSPNRTVFSEWLESKEWWENMNQTSMGGFALPASDVAAEVIEAAAKLYNYPLELLKQDLEKIMKSSN